MPKHLEDEAVRRAIGARLQAARLEKGWSQEKLAEALRLDAMTISRIETGRRSLTAGCAAQAAALMGVSVAALLGVVETPLAGEEEALHLLRQMSGGRREVALRVLRELLRMPA